MEKYLDQFDVNRPIQVFPVPLDEQEKLFIASKDLWSQYYSIQREEKLLKKYVVQAPFSGVITQSDIQSGALVIAGQKMGELIGTNYYELKTTLPLEDLPFIKKGNKVVLQTNALTSKWTGTLKRISNQIDANTQSVVVFIEVKGKGLKEGMYLRGNINTKTIQNAISIPIALLENQNQVYIIDNDKLALQKVEVVSSNVNHAIIKGLPDQTLLLNKKIVGAYEGLKVKKLETESITDNRILSSLPPQ